VTAQYSTRRRSLDIEVGVRAAVSVLVPLILLLSLDRLDLAAYAAFGAFASLYGRGEVYRTRARSIAITALIQLAAVSAGVLLSATAADGVIIAAVFGTLMIVSVVGARRFGLAPPAPIFPAFAFLVCSATAAPPDGAIVAVATAAVSCAFSVVLALSGWLVRRAPVIGGSRLLRPLERRSVVLPGAWKERAVVLVVVQILVGSAAAAVIALATGQGHAYWAVVSLVATVPSPHAPHTVSRAVHRTIGTLVGVVVTALILLTDPTPLVTILLVAVLQFCAEILVVTHYGAALVAITPLALLMVHVSTAAADATVLLRDRAIETTIGAAVAVILVLVARSRPVTRWLSGADPGAEPSH
jgi:hypothetical protein